MEEKLFDAAKIEERLKHANGGCKSLTVNPNFRGNRINSITPDGIRAAAPTPAPKYKCGLVFVRRRS